MSTPPGPPQQPEHGHPSGSPEPTQPLPNPDVPTEQFPAVGPPGYDSNPEGYGSTLGGYGSASGGYGSSGGAQQGAGGYEQHGYGYGPPPGGFASPQPEHSGGYGQSQGQPAQSAGSNYGEPVPGHGQPYPPAPGGYDPGGASGGAYGPPPPAGRQSEQGGSRRRGLWIAVVAAFLVIVLGVGVVFFIRHQQAQREAEERAERERQEAEELERRQTEEANAAAEEFFTALAAHEEVWSPEAVEATYGFGVAPPFLTIDLHFTGFGSVEDFTERCQAQAGGIEGFGALSESTRPQLAEVPGTSPEYERAQEAADASVRSEQAEQEYLTEGLAISGRILAHCDAWADGASRLHAGSRTFEEARDGFFLSQGESQSEDGWTLECNEDSCLPLARADREGYADALIAYHEDRHEILVDLHTEHCLEHYEEYCEAMIEFADTDLAGARAAMELLRGPLSQGSDPLPGYNESLDDWRSAIDERGEVVQGILRESPHPDVSSTSPSYGPHQSAVVGLWEERVAELAQAALDGGSSPNDQA